MLAGAVLVAALVLGGFALFGGRTPVVVRVESEPSDAPLELDGRVVGVTPIDLVDPAPGAHMRLSRAGFQPTESVLIAGQPVSRTTLQPLPPPVPEKQAAPAPPTPDAASATPAPPPQPEAPKPPPGAEATSGPRRPPARPAATPKAPGKAPAPEKEKRRFDLYKHLEQQSPGP
jgi:PEGA domain